MAIDPKTGIDTAVTNATEAGPGAIQNIQQLQKLAPTQVALQQKVGTQASTLLDQPTTLPTADPYIKEAREQYAAQYPGILRAIGGQTGYQRSGTLPYLLQQGTQQFETGLQRFKADFDFKRAQEQERQLDLRLKYGLAPTTEHLYTTPGGGGSFISNVLGKAAETAAPAIGQAAVQGGAALAEKAWEGLKNWGLGKGKDFTKQQPTEQDVAEYIATPEGQSQLAAEGYSPEKINEISAALKRPGQTGLADILNNPVTQAAGIGAAGVAGKKAAESLLPEATKKVVDTAAKYGANISNEAAQSVADAGITTGAAAAAGTPWAKLAVLSGLGALGVAAAIRMVYIAAQESTDDFGRGPRLREEERAREAEKNKQRAAQSEAYEKQRSEEHKKAREEAIAKGEYANATEYEKAQAEKRGKPSKTHEEQQAEINKQNEIYKKKKEELDKVLEEKRKKKEEEKKKKGGKK